MQSARRIRVRTSRTAITVLALLMLAALALPASAAHLGNNRADLSGPGSVTGMSIANNVAGQGDATGEEPFNAIATVKGLEPGSYEFRVSLNGDNPRTVCTLEAGGNGAAGCSVQGIQLGGFSQAEIVDEDGAIVATGVYDRAGNCRAPQQAGSRCDAPGQNKG